MLARFEADDQGKIEVESVLLLQHSCNQLESFLADGAGGHSVTERIGQLRAVAERTIDEVVGIVKDQGVLLGSVEAKTQLLAAMEPSQLKETLGAMSQQERGELLLAMDNEMRQRAFELLSPEKRALAVGAMSLKQLLQTLQQMSGEEIVISLAGLSSAEHEQVLNSMQPETLVRALVALLNSRSSEELEVALARSSAEILAAALGMMGDGEQMARVLAKGGVGVRAAVWEFMTSEQRCELMAGERSLSIKGCTAAVHEELEVMTLDDQIAQCTISPARAKLDLCEVYMHQHQHQPCTAPERVPSPAVDLQLPPSLVLLEILSNVLNVPQDALLPHANLIELGLTSFHAHKIHSESERRNIKGITSAATVLTNPSLLALLQLVASSSDYTWPTELAPVCSVCAEECGLVQDCLNDHMLLIEQLFARPIILAEQQAEAHTSNVLGAALLPDEVTSVEFKCESSVHSLDGVANGVSIGVNADALFKSDESHAAEQHVRALKTAKTAILAAVTRCPSLEKSLFDAENKITNLESALFKSMEDLVQAQMQANEPFRTNYQIINCMRKEFGLRLASRVLYHNMLGTLRLVVHGWNNAARGGIKRHKF